MPNGIQFTLTSKRYQIRCISGSHINVNDYFRKYLQTLFAEHSAWRKTL